MDDGPKETEPKETGEGGYDIELDDGTIVQIHFTDPTPEELREKIRANAVEFERIKLQAEFKRLTEHSEDTAPNLWDTTPANLGIGELWDASPSTAPLVPRMNLFAFDDFMWMVYTVWDVVKLWELYDMTYGEEDRPFLRKIITQFIDRRTRIELLKEGTPGE
jgi:hypothetical protein